MTEYPGDSSPTEPTHPIDPSGQAASWQPPSWQPPSSSSPPPGFQPPTWQWSGPDTPHDGYGGSARPAGSGGPSTSRSSVSKRTKVLGVAAALVLAGGSAAGGVAFGYAHASNTSSASGIASDGIGQSRQGASGGSSTTPPSTNPSQGNGGSSHHPRRGGRPSALSVPGQATASQEVGVVDINTKLKYQAAKAAGTGMILTADGEILTNNHVVEGATKIKVTIVATGDRYTATVVGTDKIDDIAVLQLANASGLTPVTTNTGTVSVGDSVVAVGNAMGVGGVPSAAKGTITGINRSITTRSEGGVDGERLTGMIQVDAQVISGDSGGPLYDSAGQVIGMDTAASSSPAQSTGFAIPIARGLSIASQIEAGQGGGNIVIGSPAFLGVEFATGSSYSRGGAVVSGVLPKTPAAKAGLITGDTITKVDGTSITSGSQLKTVLSRYKPNDSVSVTWTDTKGGSHTATVTLMAGPSQ